MPASPAPTTTLDLGGVTLTYLPDGAFRAEPAVAYPIGSEHLGVPGRSDLLDADGMLVLSVGAVLVVTPTHRVLVDAGIGPRTIPLPRPGAVRQASMWGGGLLRSLAAVGVAPDEVDAVLLSHLHADHVGWLADDVGRPTFPRAEYWVDDDEWDAWGGAATTDDPVGPRPRELAVIAARRRSLSGGASPVAEVTAVAAPGHTPGHTAFAVRGSTGSAFVVGDAVHCPAELLHPEMVWVGDHDADEAVLTRRAIVERVGGEDVVVVGPHFAGSVLRRVDPAAPSVLVTDGSEA